MLNTWQSIANNNRQRNLTTSTYGNLQPTICSYSNDDVNQLRLVTFDKLRSSELSFNSIKVNFLNNDDSRCQMSSSNDSIFRWNLSTSTIECSCCFLNQSIANFQQFYSRQCTHDKRTVCDQCVYNYIREYEKFGLIEISCPELNCKGKIDIEYIRSIFNMSDKDHIEFDPNAKRQVFIWCPYSGCDSGQYIDANYEQNSMIVCVRCQRRICSFHGTKWHKGATCQQYDRAKYLSDCAKTKLWLKKHCKRCPKCKSYIEKAAGCDHMTCRRCKHQFCWECLADHTQIRSHGRHYHMKTCSHYRSKMSNTNSNRRTSTCTIL